jgi:geranylgeranyl reductase family protein
MPSIADVIVVGGGPAGAAAAIELARAGREVVVVDKATFPRDKCCGDGLTTGALRLLDDLGLDPGDVSSWQGVDDVVVRSPSGREVTFPLPRGRGTYAAVARRVDLDAALLDVARKAGADVHEGTAVTGVRTDAERVTVELDDGRATVAAPYVVAADGMWSPVRKLVGASTPGYRGEWHAFRQYFSNVGPRAARELFVWFEPDLLPGYAWSFPLPDGRANVGFGIARDGGKVARVQDMAKLWPDLLARPHIRAVLGGGAEPEDRHLAWPIPARIDRIARSAGGGRVLFAGDAVAADDPLTGEGIGQALLTGVLAAGAIASAGPGDPALAARRYDDAVDRALVADHRMSTLLQRALSHRKGARAAVRIAAANAWTRRNFARWLFEDEPRAIAVTRADGTGISWPDQERSQRRHVPATRRPYGERRPKGCTAAPSARGGGRRPAPPPGGAATPLSIGPTRTGTHAVNRRQFLGRASGMGMALALGPSFWERALGAPAQPGDSPYGPLQPADANGLELPAGFSSRVVARSLQPVAGTGYLWHAFPDGGACVPTPDGGWVYVSNSENPPPVIDEDLPGLDLGGVGAIRFAPDGAVVAAYSILTGSRSNCAGGLTPWGTWLTCEEWAGGQVWECDPLGVAPAVARPALGTFKHEMAAVDPAGERVYLSEDQPDGRFYRYTPPPGTWGSGAALEGGTLEAMAVAPDGATTWVAADDGAATTFDGGEGCVHDSGRIYLTTKGDDRVWVHDLAAQTMTVLYDSAEFGDAPVLNGVDNIVASAAHDLYVAEDGGNLEVCIITPDLAVAPVVRMTGPQHGFDSGTPLPTVSEVTGLAFSPDGNRLYFNSERGGEPTGGFGILYEVTGPWRGGTLADAARPALPSWSRRPWPRGSS